MIHMTLRLFDPLRIKRHDQNMCEGVLKIQRREEKVRYEQKTKISLKNAVLHLCDPALCATGSF